MSGKPWTTAERDALRAAYPDTDCRDIAMQLGRTMPAVYSQAALMGLSKAEGHAARAGRVGAQHPRAVAQRFKPGIKSWNAGQHYQPGGRCAETQFKTGNRSGRASELHKPIGTERVSKDGYLERKINDDMPLHKRWRAVHLIEWEAVNGPLPAGHALTFRDGNKQNTTLDNLELVSRADLMRRNTRHNLPPELNELISLRAALVRKINNRTKDAE
jgi:hypothetical protein